MLFILPAVTYLVIFIMFDMKLLFLVWKNQNLGNNDTPEAMRRRLTLFYIQFCRYVFM